MIFWRRGPEFKKVVRPEEPVEKVYCRVLEGSVMEASQCRSEKGWFPRLVGVLAIPDRSSRTYRVGERIGVAGGTFLLYPGTLRPGSCTDDKGNASISYLCEYPDLSEFTEEGLTSVTEGRYFRLRDDVEEVGSHLSRFGHPVYIVRNRLGETFRLAGVYARIYEILREKGGWVKGEDLLGEDKELLKRYTEKMGEIDRMSQDELEELVADFANTLADVGERLTDLLLKLNHGNVEELPPPGTIPADLERLIAKIESYDALLEIQMLSELPQRLKDKYGGDESDAFWSILYSYSTLALGLLVYEALIVEMGLV